MVLAGCSKPESRKDKDQSQSTAEQVIDGVTGHGAVRSGKQAMDKLEEVSRREQENLREVMGE